MENVTANHSARETFFYFVLFMFASSVVANGYFAGIARKNSAMVENERDLKERLQEENVSLHFRLEDLAKSPATTKENVEEKELAATVPRQIADEDGKPEEDEAYAEKDRLLEEGKAYFVKSIGVGDRVYPVYVDFEYYNFLKKNQSRIFNEKALDAVFLPKSRVLTEAVEMIKADFGEQSAEVLLEFVHNVGYSIDPYNKSFYANNLTQFGEVTIVDGGDCLNLSILLLNLYHIAGYDAILVQFNDHAVVGIATEATGSSIIVEGKKYFMADPANHTRIGELGDKYEGKSIVRIYRIIENASGFSVSATRDYEWI